MRMEHFNVSHLEIHITFFMIENDVDILERIVYERKERFYGDK